MKKNRVKARHPIQPIVEDSHGVLRFKANAVVEYLLDKGGLNMNDLAMIDFPREDREQFAQLIGYSHSGSGDLGYVSDEVWLAAIRMYENGSSELECRNHALRTRFDDLVQHMRDAATVMFKVHPDDLELRE